MRVLVATKELQGTAPGDYDWTVEGELVVVDVTECAHPQRCGCERGFPGIASRKATTTAMVAELPHLTRAELLEVIADHVERHWADLLRDGAESEYADPSGTVEEQLAEIADEYLADIEHICAEFPVGTVIQRDGTLVSARAFPAAA